MKKNKLITRFAPSPTGKLHIGNARSAILNWLHAKKNDGYFILRIDDTDTERSKDEFIDKIKEDINWLGLDYTKTFKQSERMELYNKAIKKLKIDNRLYECFETQEELMLKRKSLLSSGKPPIYDRSALNLTEKEKKDLILRGKKSHWRFKLNEEKIIWKDIIRGDVLFDSTLLSDPILIREDGSLLYHLPSVIDDINENITDIIRGEDHVNNTAFHIQIFKALNSNPPRFGHHPLLRDSKGQGLGKRLNSISLNDLRNENLESLTILNYLSTIGTSENLSTSISAESVYKNFNLENLTRSSPKFNKEDLFHINQIILKQLDFMNVKNSLIKMGIKDPSIEFWNCIKNNISVMSEASEWWNIINQEKIIKIVDKDFLKLCASVLPDEPFNLETWDIWLKKIKELSTKKGSELFQPLRLALTGKKTGPELKFLLPLLSRKLVLIRLGN